MTFTADEKKLIKFVLEKHLHEIEKVEKLPNQLVGLIATEVRYEDFIKGILKKL